MIFDSQNRLDMEQFKLKCNQLYKKGLAKRTIIELVEKQTFTKEQNGYLHVIIKYLALQLGESSRYVKQNLYKYAANHDLFFLGWREDKFTGLREPKLRSSSTLTESEMSMSIDRFIDWTAQNCDILLPRPEQKEFLQEAIIETIKNQKYIL